MTSPTEESIQSGHLLPNLELPLDDQWHQEGGTVSLRAGPRRAALLLYLPHGAAGADETDGEDSTKRPPCEPCRSFIEDLMGASGIIALESGTIAVASPEGHWMLENRMGVPDTGDHLIEDHLIEARLIITDRFGEAWDVYAARAEDNRTDHGAGDDAFARTDVHEELPSTPKLIEWVDYLGTQCPECGVLDTTHQSWRTI